MKFKKWLVAALFIPGLWQLSSSVYMLAKAELSQVLIHSAWEKTLKNGEINKPWSWADTYPIARLKSFQQKKQSIILEGSSGRNLAFSATHLPQSGLPGENKTIIISGHNDSHFEYLKDIKVGDNLILETRDSNTMYQVSKINIIDSKFEKIKIKNVEELVLTTCYPFNSLMTGGNLRYVVVALPVPGSEFT